MIPPESFDPRAWWELLKQDHRENPEALPFILEASGCMYAASVIATVLLFDFALAYCLIGIGALALCMGLREIVKRWEP